MATISLDTAQIQSLNSEITTLDSTLLGTYFPSVSEELTAISSNVQGDELQEIIATINNQFESVKTALSTALPKLETFLEEQLTGYSTTESELDAELQAVLSKMSNLVDGTASNLAGGSAATASEIEELRAQVAEANKSNFQKTNEEFVNDFLGDGAEYGSRVANDWVNVGESFASGNIVSGLGNAAGAIFTTAGNTVGLVYNEALNSVDWVLDTAFGTDTLLGKLGDWLS